MADEEILNSGTNREINTLELFLSFKAQKTALTLEEYIQTRLSQGVAPEVLKTDLINDLLNNGRIFSEFRNAIKATAKGSINRTRDTAYFSEFGIDRKYRWSAILVNTCPDCLERHGVVKTWEEWEDEGLPRTGSTVCRENCHCVLVPEEFTALQPIQRAKR